MRRILLLSILLLTATSSGAQNATDSLIIRQIHDFSLVNGKAYDWLNHICLNIGGRLAGSPQSEKAIQYTYEVMDSIVPGNVSLQEVMVVNWKRGEKENCYTTDKKGNKTHYRITSLGNSVGTPLDGITAPVIKLNSFAELNSLSTADVQGKIVFYDEPMDQRFINSFSAYSSCGSIRWYGPKGAAPLGALATINRSLTHASDDHPHTGSIVYVDSIPKIPGAAISTSGADLLSKALAEDPDLTLTLEMDCKMLDDIKSYNVIGEIKGTEHPEEIIVVGGHLDAWDNGGQGAHDDGAGCVQSMEVLNIFNSLNIRPKRTIRIVMFMNEENGVRGGKKYADNAKEKNEKHIAAIESDAGGFSPRGYYMDGDADKLSMVKKWIPLFQPYLLHSFDQVGGGADISGLKSQGAVVMGLYPDSQRYFDYHHAETDTFDKVNRRELQLGAAALASMAYLISEYGLDNIP